MRIIRSLLLIVALASSLKVEGSVVRIAEQNLADALATSLSSYRSRVSTEPVTSWSQLERISTALIGLNAYLNSGSITEIYSFVPLEQRSRFPSGNLVLVQSNAMAWPDAWKTEDPEKPGQYLEHPRHQDIRFLIYEKDGKFIAERWYETKFQSMLAETGLTIPPPTPYYPPPPTPPGEKLAALSAPSVPVVAAETTPTAAPATVPKPAPAPATPPPAKSSNPLWWIVGAIAALVTVVLIVRRKNPKA